MRYLKALALAATATGLSVSPLEAQVYVPLTNYQGDGTALELVITNVDETSAHSFSGTILAEGSDGTVDPGTPTEPVSVDPGATRVVKAPPGSGLWRLDADPQLHFGARMRVPTGPTDPQGVGVPILSADNVSPANELVVVQSLVAAHGYLTDVALFNAGTASTRCEAAIHLVGGQQIGPDFALHLAPRSLSLFENVAAIAAVPDQISQIRVSMSCDQAFYVYSRTVNPQTGYLAIHTAATADGAALPDLTNEPPPTDSEPPPPPPPSDDDEPSRPSQTARFTRNGKFYTVTSGSPNLVMNMGVPADAIYGELRVSFDFKHAGWNRKLPDGIHNLVYITRGSWSGDVFTLVTARGPGKNLVRNEITVDLPKNEVSQKAVGASLQPNTDYHLDYTYNHKARKWRVVISRGGSAVVDFSGPTTGPVWTKNGSWRIFLSDETVSAHVTSLGWEYSNLLVEWVP